MRFIRFFGHVLDHVWRTPWGPKKWPILSMFGQISYSMHWMTFIFGMILVRCTRLILAEFDEWLLNFDKSFDNFFQDFNMRYPKPWPLFS